MKLVRPNRVDKHPGIYAIEIAQLQTTTIALRLRRENKIHVYNSNNPCQTFTYHHADEGRGEEYSLSECCNQRVYAPLQVACQQR